MKLFVALAIAMSFAFCALSQMPQYYQTISDSDTGFVLKQQLSDLIITTHTNPISYTPGVWNVLERADRDLEDTTKVLLIYGFDDSDASTVNDRSRLISLRQTGSSSVGRWNREHVFPKSLGTPDLGTAGAGSDAHHIRAADGQFNSTRNNRPFTAGSGNASTIGSNFFYPGDEWKGDVARMMMYQYLRYPTQCNPRAVGDDYISVSHFDDMIDLFIIWHEEDPVSEFEQQRNNVIYQTQGNRNPFIDEPNYATRIWGPASSASGLSIDEGTHNPFRIYPNPAGNYIFISSEKTTSYSVSIQNTMEQLVYEGENVSEIDLKNLNSGTYFVTIQTEKMNYTSKVVHL